jgi:hypothetical protein
MGFGDRPVGGCNSISGCGCIDWESLLRRSKWWGIAVGMVVTDLLLGGIIAMLNRFGTAR